MYLILKLYPLNKRIEDIPPLIDYFIDNICNTYSYKKFKIKDNEHLSLAGVFRVLNGKIRSHVQPDYKDIKHEYYDPKQMKCVKDFLQFY